MKKFLSIILSMSMILSMGIMSFASNEGDIYEVDEDGDLVSASSTLIPGTTYYIYLTEYKSNMDSSEIPTKVKLEYEGSDYATDKKVSVLSSGNLSVSRRKLNGDYAYFAAMKLKSISASSYRDKEIVLDIKNATVYYKDGKTEELESVVRAYDIEYDDCYEITKKPTVISLDDTKETFNIENSNATVEIDSTGVKTEMVISCDTSYDMRFGENYMNANLEFYKFSGASSRKAMILTIPKNGFKYLYERTETGLRDITKVSGSDFIVRTSKLGSYVVSNMELPANAVGNQNVILAPDETAPAPNTTQGTVQGPTGGNIPYNPGTGAAI